MNLSFQIQSEPKNPMLGRHAGRGDQRGRRDRRLAGAAEGPEQPTGRTTTTGGYRGHNTYGNLNLIRGGDKTATTIKSLKGKVGIMLLAGTSPGDRRSPTRSR